MLLAESLAFCRRDITRAPDHQAARLPMVSELRVSPPGGQMFSKRRSAAATQPAQKSAQKSTRKPAQKLAQKPARKPARKPAQKFAGKVTAKAASTDKS